MSISILLILLYLLLVILGAEAVVCGASRIARRLHVSDFLIGMLIVGFGTSLPELVVSLTGAIEGHPDVSVGNIVGTNIFNLLAILGISALIIPLQMTARNRKFDIPATIVITVFSLVVCLSGNIIGRGEGIAMMILFCGFILWSIANGQEQESVSIENDDHCGLHSIVWGSRKKEIVVMAILIVVGLGMLLIGGYLLVNESVALAEMLGVSDRMIAILLLAIGTSLPELVTSIAAARRGMSQLVLGNILGSNIFNLLLILGMSATIHPLEVSGMCPIDWIGMGLSIILLYLLTAPRPHRLERWQGILFLLLMGMYAIMLFRYPY